MVCPKCGSPMGRNRRYCERCGMDTSVSVQLYRRSNRFYNEGLKKARVRDLSGAIVMLKKSLEYNKRNIEARNLLGLVYYELGEPVTALSEWIISKHFSPENNLADYFVEKVQSNPAKLDAVNQSVKKFNQALAYAKQGSDDLAMLQLRKVVGANPGYVRALQLLALLYMKNEEYEKAKRCLVRARKTDVANTTTLSYLAEIDRILNADGPGNHTEKAIEGMSYQPVSASVSYQEDKPNYIAFITFFAGIIIGIAVLYWLIVPTVRSDIKDEYAAKERDYGVELSSYTTTISVLESEKKNLEDKLELAEDRIADLEWEMDADAQEEFNVDNYEQAMLVLLEYPDLAAKIKEAEEEKKPQNALNDAIAYGEKLLANEEGAKFRKKSAEAYTGILEEVASFVKEHGYDRGRSLYDAKKYKEALVDLLAVYRMGEADADTLYYLGRSYQKDGDEENARVYYQELVQNYPDSDRAKSARQNMKDLD